MPRGGPRPGAGAPKGNMNAVKHGRNSARIQTSFDILLAMPEIRQLLLVLWIHSLSGTPAEKRRKTRIFERRLDDLGRQSTRKIRLALTQIQKAKPPQN